MPFFSSSCTTWGLCIMGPSVCICSSLSPAHSSAIFMALFTPKQKPAFLAISISIKITDTRLKPLVLGLGSWVLSLASIFSPPPPFSLQHLLSSYCPYLCVWHHLLFLTANDLSWNRDCPLPSPLQ